MNSTSLPSLIPFLINKTRWPQHLGQLARRVGYSSILLETINNPSIVESKIFIPVIEWLLTKGASPTVNKNGFTPLMLLCQKNYSEEVQEVLVEAASMFYKKGADLDTQFSHEKKEHAYLDGRTPILFAGANGKLKLLKWFFEKGCQCDLKDKSGKDLLSLLKESSCKESLDWWLSNHLINQIEKIDIPAGSRNTLKSLH